MGTQGSLSLSTEPPSGDRFPQQELQDQVWIVARALHDDKLRLSREMAPIIDQRSSKLAFKVEAIEKITGLVVETK